VKPGCPFCQREADARKMTILPEPKFLQIPQVRPFSSAVSLIP